MARGLCAVEGCGEPLQQHNGYCNYHFRREMRQLQAIKRALNYGVLKDLLTIQNHACALCFEPFGSPDQAVPDHDHSTGNLRGLLCRRCNNGIGHFKESTDLLLRAVSYLEDSALWYNQIRIDEFVRRRVGTISMTCSDCELRQKDWDGDHNFPQCTDGRFHNWQYLDSIDA
jgi:hypothetical protein